MKRGIFLIVILFTIFFLSSTLVLTQAANDEVSFVLTVTPEQLSGNDAVIPVGISSDFAVNTSMTIAPPTSEEMKPGAAQWHCNGVTGIGTTTIGADAQGVWTESGSRTIAIVWQVHIDILNDCKISKTR
ncbi:MAG: hypothetical protein LBP59_15040 [Planctomycetaceae bacterium]|jgi:hypothetical protein|nr:hypothetical protein [Planctomycetaceae bacterium]